ncbi:MAG TPA: alpha-E domain-containing protein [Candidatus Cybelea sp.]|nr:alpha-E domain-containing protein [Candidatus Cybelea sp.]
MLSRTADSLFWLSRYIERADYLARTLEAAQRLSSLPTAYAGEVNEWESAVQTAGCGTIFHDKHETATAETVNQFLICAPENPSSIVKCVEIARTNARAVRTALTSEMWDAINGAWLELQGLNAAKLGPSALPKFLAWVKETSLRVDGSGYRTMLRNDAYWFSRLGIFVERADNTARILDVKYHILLPENATVGGGIDYSQWAAILRAVSALTSYHWVYRESLKPWLIADLLILNRQMPRSLASCYQNIVGNLDEIAGAYNTAGLAQRAARGIDRRLGGTKIEQVFQSGLHEFITTFIGDNNRVGSAISAQYLV